VNVSYLSIAEEELGKAIEYYEEKEVGLGLRFYAEYRAALERILAYPDAWYALSGNTRRCRTKVFPFGIIYQLRNDGILIVAVSELHQKPGYWKDRIQEAD